MLFNSITFLIFLPLVFALYWSLRNKNKLQNILILVASYIFYGWWDWRFLSLIILSTIVDYLVAQKIGKTKKQKIAQVYLGISLFVNLGLLCIFKYYNFFVSSWIDLWEVLGVEMHASTLNIILPVGISFYTFQTLSYTIDVYRKEISPSNSILNFAAYVAFFPQLVAGPIERASRLLPQFEISRKFSYEFAKSGVYLIIWGFFKKVVIADNCAFFVNQIFENQSSFSSLELFLGSVLFAFQIYGDFSGYSDIAIGTARLFGFRLMTNFSFPYFSRDIAEFWRRWHISLSTWFRDYVYIPLGGSRGSKFMQLRNVMIIFLVSGFWHGANWTFITWGAIHAMLFIPLLITSKNRTNINADNFHIKQVLSILGCFILVCLAWVFFRADNISVAMSYLIDIFQLNDPFNANLFISSSKYKLFTIMISSSILIMLLFELKAFLNNCKEVKLNKLTALFLIFVIIIMGVFKNQSDFIYFQF